MINSVYQLIAPRMIDVACKEIDFTAKDVILRPVKLSICKADQRYYQGQRPPEVMKKKLPMALIHECVAEVVYDPSGIYRAGDKVVPVPTVPTVEDDIIGENYRKGSYFRSSGSDGFLQDIVSSPAERLVSVPSEIDNFNVVSFTELISVSVQAVRRFDLTAHARRNSVGIWGDGNVGFITALIFHAMYPETKLYVFGTVQEKLSYFSFAENVYHIDRVDPDLQLDHAFECVGGAGSPGAINQIIDLINPEGTMVLMGVSENLVSINTRMVLEKGLRMIGTSRSAKTDFAEALRLLAGNKRLVRYLDNLVGDIVPVKTIPDIHHAFDLDYHRSFGKTVIDWIK